MIYVPAGTSGNVVSWGPAMDEPEEEQEPNKEHLIFRRRCRCLKCTEGKREQIGRRGRGPRRQSAVAFLVTRRPEPRARSNPGVG